MASIQQVRTLLQNCCNLSLPVCIHRQYYLSHQNPDIYSFSFHVIPPKEIRESFFRLSLSIVYQKLLTSLFLSDLQYQKFQNCFAKLNLYELNHKTEV